MSTTHRNALITLSPTLVGGRATLKIVNQAIRCFPANGPESSGEQLIGEQLIGEQLIGDHCPVKLMAAGARLVPADVAPSAA